MQLTKIHQYQAELSEYVLRSRSNIDNNFDSISAVQTALRNSSINTQSSFIQNNDLFQLATKTNEILIRKIEQAEKFKSLHAKINNSLRYLPALKQKIDEKTTISNAKKNTIQSILINSFNFRLFNDVKFLDAITLEITKLNKTHKENKKNDQALIASFIDHSNLLLKLRQKESHTLQALISNNLDQHVSRLEKSFSDMKNLETDSTHNIKMYLLLYSALLFILTIIFLLNRHQLIASILKHKDLSEKDQLTGLNNRRSFLNILKESLKKIDGSDQYGAVMFIDLDGFKAINDNLGHNSGDKVLKILAERFMHYLKRRLEQNIELNAARLGGDEFVVMIDQLNRNDLSQEIDKTAKDLLKICASPLGHEFKGFPLSASIGIAIYPEHGDDVTEILNAADKAMYHSKLLGKNRYTLFTGHP